MAVAFSVPIPVDDDARVADLTRMGSLLTAPDAVLDEVTRELARIFEVPSAAISFVDRDTQHYKSAIGVPEPFATTRTEPREMSICSFVVGDNDMLIVEDLARDDRFCDSLAVTDFGLRFYAGAPLRAESGRAIGSLCILDQRPRSITDRERELLRMVAEGVMAHVTLQAASQQLYDFTTRMDEELRRAERVQRYLLPPACIERGDWTIRHLYRPMARLGGDFIDVVTRPDGRMAVLVADVTGHGTDAALMSAMIKTAFARAVADDAHPNDILRSMNRALTAAAPPDQFITAISAVLDATGRAVEVSAAGHPPPLLVRDGGVETVAVESNIPLAIDPEAQFEARTTVLLGTDERLLLYTDGAFEVSAGADRAHQLGIAGLARLVGDVADEDGAGLLRRVLARVDEFARGRIYDDVALVGISRR